MVNGASPAQSLLLLLKSGIFYIVGLDTDMLKIILRFCIMWKFVKYKMIYAYIFFILKRSSSITSLCNFKIILKMDGIPTYNPYQGPTCIFSGDKQLSQILQYLVSLWLEISEIFINCQHISVRNSRSSDRQSQPKLTSDNLKLFSTHPTDDRRFYVLSSSWKVSGQNFSMFL